MNDTINNNPTILITGSEGSLAQWIINKLPKSYKLVGMDNFFRHGKVDRFRDYEFVEGDLCDATWVNQLIAKYKPTYVLHCAAQIYGVKGFHLYSADIISNNLVSTANLAKACVDNDIKKIVYISSSMVYENAQVFPLREEFTNTIAMPNTGYGISKLVGERIIQEYHNQYGLSYVIWRPFNIITPHERSEQEPGIAHVFADFIQKIIIDCTPEIEIFGDGTQTRCFTWIDDIANVIVNKSFDCVTDNQIYNVGSEVPTTVLELATKIFTASNRTDEFVPKFSKIYNDDVKMRIPDCSKAKSIGFQHTKTIDELVDICVSNIPGNRDN